MDALKPRRGLDELIDDGIVVDAYVLLTAVQTQVATVDARMLITSIDTFLRLAQELAGDDQPIIPRDSIAAPNTC